MAWAHFLKPQVLLCPPGASARHTEAPEQWRLLHGTDWAVPSGHRCQRSSLLRRMQNSSAASQPRSGAFPSPWLFPVPSQCPNLVSLPAESLSGSCISNTRVLGPNTVQPREQSVLLSEVHESHHKIGQAAALLLYWELGWKLFF